MPECKKWQSFNSIRHFENKYVMLLMLSGNELRLLCNKYQRQSSLNLVSQQLKLCSIFIFGMAYCFSRLAATLKKHGGGGRNNFS